MSAQDGQAELLAQPNASGAASPASSERSRSASAANTVSNAAGMTDSVSSVQSSDSAVDVAALKASGLTDDEIALVSGRVSDRPAARVLII